MKHVLFTDTHMGCRDDHPLIAAHQKEVYEQIFTYMDMNNITSIYHLGDFFDNRKKISMKTLEFLQWFLNETAGYQIKQIVGNHDTAYKNSNELNSPEILLTAPNITILSEDTVEEDDILWVNWINSSNYESVIKTIQRSNAKYCFGHFDIQGFAFQSGGMVSKTGLSQDIFFKFKKVLSGHFHSRQVIGNIEYIGSPFEMSWSDFNDKKGFMVFDDEAGTFEFITHGVSLFHKLEVSSSGKVETPPIDTFEGKIIRLVSHFDQKTTDKLITKIHEKQVGELQVVIVPPKLEVVESTVDLQTTDIRAISKSYIDSYCGGNEKLTALVGELLEQAQHEM